VNSRQDLSWLVTTFVERVPRVAHAVVVSSDGLPMAYSEGFPADRVDQLAAIASGLTSLTQGAARIFEGGAVTQTLVEMERGLLFVMAISDGSVLGVLAAPGELVLFDPALENAQDRPSSATHSPATASTRATRIRLTRAGMPCDSSRRVNHSSSCGSSGCGGSASCPRLRLLGVSRRDMQDETIPETPESTRAACGARLTTTPI
jgi:predicted regulator of Ras-like GTPase activity (Roadblock/LC7/MglB family)